MIKEAEIDVANLILIVGDNSLGKTLLLEAYTLFINSMKDRMNDFIKAGFIHNLEFQKEDKVIDLNGLLKESQTDSNVKFTIIYDEINEAEFAEFDRQSKQVYLDILKKKVLMDTSSQVDIQVLYDLDAFKQISVEVEILRESGTVVLRLRDDKQSLARYLKMSTETLGDEELLIKTIENLVPNLISRSFYERLYRIETILFYPSERNLYKANALVKSADFISDSFSVTENDSDMRYSETLFVSSYLKYINMVKILGNHSQSNEALYEVLCQSIGGEPIYEDGVVTSIMQKDKKLPSNLFSTKQSRLVPYFMLSHDRIHSDLVIIEEPEAHMSLKSMFELVKVVRNLLQSKRLILTSHSDVFVSLLNNMIKQYQVDAKVYELLEKDGTASLVEVEAGEFGYELSFMSEALRQLNIETREAFSAELNESDE